MEVASSHPAVSGGSASIDLSGTPDAAPPPFPVNCAADGPAAAEPCDVTADPPPSEAQPKAACSGDGAQHQDGFDLYVETIKAYCEPRLTASAWSFLGLDKRLRIDMPPSQFLASMEDEFGADALLEINFLEQAGEEVRPASVFNGDPPLYVVIDKQKRSLHFEHDGDLFFLTGTALDFALERISPKSTLATQNLFVVGCEDDVEVIRALGLRAVTATGLDSLRRTEVARLFPDDPRTDVDWQYHLILLDFDVAKLKKTLSAAIAGVIERLADVADLYGIDPGRRFAVCRLTNDEFNELKLATTFEDSGRIRQLFEGWATNATRQKVDSWRIQSRRPAMTYSAASAALRRALEIQDGYLRRLEVGAALHPYRAAGQGNILAKLNEAVDGEADAFDQLELIAASGYAETFFENDPLLHAAEAVLAGKTPPSARELSEGLLNSRQRCMSELRRIHRGRRPKR
jgi:hypothetical protein